MSTLKLVYKVVLLHVSSSEGLFFCGVGVGDGVVVGSVWIVGVLVVGKKRCYTLGLPGLQAGGLLLPVPGTQVHAVTPADVLEEEKILEEQLPGGQGVVVEVEQHVAGLSHPFAKVVEPGLALHVAAHAFGEQRVI